MPSEHAGAVVMVAKYGPRLRDAGSVTDLLLEMLHEEEPPASNPDIDVLLALLAIRLRSEPALE